MTNKKEAAARLKINKMLEESGWRLVSEGDKRANVDVETRLNPGEKLNTNDAGADFENTKGGFIDYLLLDDNQKPIAVLEAKRESIAPLLFSLAGMSFVSANIRVVRIQPATYSAILLAGAVLWLMGNIGWLISGNPWLSIPYGLSFLVMTIAGERLELTRFLPPRPLAARSFILIAALVLMGTIIAGAYHFSNNALLGLSYALLALWLIQFDIARKTIRQPGITRFVAICLLSGYGWLLIGGLLMVDIWQPGIFQRDAAIHAMTLGFIFAMVIGHAPIIFPAVVRVAIPFSGIFYLPLVLINLGVLLRLAAALISNPIFRTTGAVTNAIGILSFMLCILLQVARGVRQRHR